MDEDAKKAFERATGVADMAKKIADFRSVMSRTLEKQPIHMAKVPNIDHSGLTAQLAALRPPRPEETNRYQSAAVLMEALAKEAMHWKEQLPEGLTPAILAILYGGIQIHVDSLTQVGFHGIRIEGTMDSNPCAMLAHQATVQMLCYAEPVADESEKRPIGFVWDGESLEV